MISFELNFSPHPETLGDGPNDFENLLESWLSALTRNGNIASEWQLLQLGNRIQVRTVAVAPDALDRNNWDAPTEKDWANLQSLLLEPFDFHTVGDLPKEPTWCNCEKPSSRVLFTTFIDQGSPVSCLDCGQDVPLYHLPHLNPYGGHNEFRGWQSDYKAFDHLWMGSDIGERYSYRQLARPKSDFMKETRQLAEQLEAASGMLTYWFLLHYHKKWGKNAHYAPANGAGKTRHTTSLPSNAITVASFQAKPAQNQCHSLNFTLKTPLQTTPKMATLNLSPVRYERWLKVIFDHPAPSSDEESKADFYWQRDIEFFVSDTPRLLSHFTRMCREFVAVSERFTLPQLNQGIWFILGSEVEMGKLLADESIPLKQRLDCTQAMLVPFRDFVAQCEVEVLENCFWMWWDLLLTYFWNEHLWRLKEDELMEAMYGDDYGTASHNIEISFDDLKPDAQAMLNTMLETLIAIAELYDERAMSYGLHGLGHLRHPKGSAWLQRFIDEHRTEFDEDGLKWLEQCRDGTVM